MLRISCGSVVPVSFRRWSTAVVGPDSLTMDSLTMDNLTMDSLPAGLEERPTIRAVGGSMGGSALALDHGVPFGGAITFSSCRSATIKMALSSRGMNRSLT